MTPSTVDLPERLPRAIPERRAELRAVLGDAIAAGAGRSWTDEEFDRLALAVFRYQADASPVYGGFVRNRGLDLDALDDWRAIPPVPTRAFKELSLIADAGAPVEATFLTSGTTAGAERRGVHRVRDLSLYRASALQTAEHFLQITRTRIRVLILGPSPERRPDSSLMHMFGVWKERWDDGGGGYFADPDWSLEHGELGTALKGATADGIPVLVAGTAFAFLAWLELGGPGRTIELPVGSLLVETGGFKGRTRTVPRGELYARLAGALGVPPRRIVNEYGMTELLSQFYEPVLLEEGPDDPERRRHIGPPWVRTRVLDPATLAPVGPGDTGILCHVDLANLDSISAVLTEDRGRRVGEGFRLLGRAEGAEPRGCSLAMDDLLEGA